MEIITNKTVDMLNQNSVSILTRNYVDIEGTLTQVGENHRCAYSNSESGRALLQTSEPENVVTAVFAIWGNSPTVEEPVWEGENTESEE